MSVPEGKRNSGRMEVFVKTQGLASYTAKILSNAKIFKPEVDAVLIDKIKECAYGIHTKTWTANKIRADTNESNRKMRYERQEEAILLCDEMLAYIYIAKSVFHLKAKRMDYWSRMIIEVRKFIQAWKESDVKRYGQP